MPWQKKPRPWNAADPDGPALRALAKAHDVVVRVDVQARARGAPHVVLTARRAGGVELGRFKNYRSALRWLGGATCPRNEI